MYFTDRYQLGDELAKQGKSLCDDEPIVICLKESGLSTCIALASKLHGWIYPLLTEPVIIPGDPRIIGIINQDGRLCYNPGLSTFEREELEMDYQSVISESSREAFSRLNRRTSEYGDLQTSVFQGRTVVICGDIVRDQLEIAAAFELLKPIKVQKIVSLVGNIQADVSSPLYLQSNESQFLDTLSFMFDDDHYFEQVDAYSIEERRKLAMNISQYWV